MRSIRDILKKEYEPKGRKFGVIPIKKWVMSVGSIFNSTASQALASFYTNKKYDGLAYVRDFGKPYDLPEKYVIEQAESFIKFGFVPPHVDA